MTGKRNSFAYTTVLFVTDVSMQKMDWHMLSSSYNLFLVLNEMLEKKWHLVSRSTCSGMKLESYFQRCCGYSWLLLKTYACRLTVTRLFRLFCLQLALLLWSSVRIGMPYVTLSRAQFAILGSIQCQFSRNLSRWKFGVRRNGIGKMLDFRHDR